MLLAMTKKIRFTFELSGDHDQEAVGLSVETLLRRAGYCCSMFSSEVVAEPSFKPEVEVNAMLVRRFAPVCSPGQKATVRVNVAGELMVVGTDVAEGDAVATQFSRAAVDCLRQLMYVHDRARDELSMLGILPGAARGE